MEHFGESLICFDAVRTGGIEYECEGVAAFVEYRGTEKNLCAFRDKVHIKHLALEVGPPQETRAPRMIRVMPISIRGSRTRKRGEGANVSHFVVQRL